MPNVRRRAKAVVHDPNHRERATVQAAWRKGVKSDICSLIAMGYGKYQILAHICGGGEGAPTRAQAEEMLRQAQIDIDRKYERYSQQAAKYNTNRLIQLIEDNYRSGDHKIVLQAIDILNKMGGLYKNTLDFDTNAPVVQLSFGGSPTVKPSPAMIPNPADFEDVKEDLEGEKNKDNLTDWLEDDTTTTTDA